MVLYTFLFLYLELTTVLPWRSTKTLLGTISGQKSLVDEIFEHSSGTALKIGMLSISLSQLVSVHRHLWTVVRKGDATHERFCYDGAVFPV